MAIKHDITAPPAAAASGYFDSAEEARRKWPEYYHSNVGAFVLFLVFVIYKYLQIGYRVPALGAIRIEFIMGIILSLIAIPAFLKNPNRTRSGIGIWASLLLVIMVIMSFFSYEAYSYDIFEDHAFKFALLAVFIAAFVTTPVRLGLFVGAFLLACLKMGQEGLVGTITGSLIWENQGVPRLHGVTPIYAHPNSFSGMALGSLPFAVYFYGLVPWYLRIVLLTAVVFALNIIVRTGSRTGYIGLTIGLVFLVWHAKNRKRALLILFLVGISVAPLIPNDYIERAQSIFTLEDKEGHSTERREEILRDAWEVFLDNPLGVGVGAFPAVRGKRFGRFQDTHNLYLEVATNLGVEGLVIFFGLIIAILRVLYKLASSVMQQIGQLGQSMGGALPKDFATRLVGHLQDLQVIEAGCFSVLLFIITRLVLGLFGHDLYEVYWWFALGTSVALWNINVVAQRRTKILCGYSGGGQSVDAM